MVRMDVQSLNAIAEKLNNIDEKMEEMDEMKEKLDKLDDHITNHLPSQLELLGEEGKFRDRKFNFVLGMLGLLCALNGGLIALVAVGLL